MLSNLENGGIFSRPWFVSFLLLKNQMKLHTTSSALSDFHYVIEMVVVFSLVFLFVRSIIVTSKKKELKLLFATLFCML